jgi:hypothetical protein
MAIAAAGAPWSFSTLKRRITMLREPASHSWTGRAVAATVITAAVAAIVPLRLSARPQAVGVPAVTPDRSLTQLLATASDGRQEKDRELNYVLFLDDHTTNTSGTRQDIEIARRYRRGAERLLWFRQNGREYVVRDPAVIEQVLDIWKPVNVIGAQMGKLGGRQGELGARQGEIGERQGRIGAEQGAIGAQQGALGARQGELAAREISSRTDAERRSIDAEHRRIDEEMRVLDRKMREAVERMREFEKPMDDLNEQMDGLNREMEVLSAKMQTAVRLAETKMQALMDKSIASGVAVPVK